MKQTTLKETITIQGIGLHGGLPSVLNIHPAKANTCIVFCRNDIEHLPQIVATYDNVVNTQNCTCIGNKDTVINTIEHLMAALYVAKIDNAFIECNNPELPIMDGSAAIFYDILQKAEKVEQDCPRKYLKVLKPVRFNDDKGNFIELQPSTQPALHICFDIEFTSKIVGKQNFNDTITPEIFAQKIAPCRTFCEKYQIDYLKSLGLIKGGSLENAVVLDGENILNPEGFRVENECVNHKVLDAIGDMYTSGFHILGNLKAFRTGHYHNNEILKMLFTDKENFEII